MEIDNEITDELNNVSNSKWKSEMRYYAGENGSFDVILMTYYKNGESKFSTENNEVDDISTISNLSDDEINIIAKHSDLSFEQIKENFI